MSAVREYVARHRRVAAAGGAALSILMVAGAWRGADGPPELLAPVSTGALTAHLTVTGTLKPIQAMTYRSPLVGREAEITALVAEGTLVQEGDLIATLDTTALSIELDRARQDVRQAEADLQLAEVDREEAEASATAAAEGEGALTVEEAQARLHAAERRATRLREEHAQLEPLLKRGFITREELRKTADALDAAEEDLALTRKRVQVLVELTRPRELQRTRLQRAQKAAQLEQARTRLAEARVRAQALEALVASGSIHARRPGLVIHEELLSANPRRKVRVGDRVTASQGLLTIPEVDRMVMETSVAESEVRRVRPGQRARIQVDAFPALPLQGTVTRVGTLARPAPDRPFDDKRFDVQIELETVSPALRPEMSARADITVAHRPRALLAPVTAIFDTSEGLVAYVKQREGYEARRVEIGESDGTSVELLSGVVEGDRLMLVDPRSTSTRRRPSSSGAPAIAGPPDAHREH
jgi:multidrug efflux pump subunit AcrA (membrane-fusion protein)